jgi:site-specific DNA-cytosine methylase
MLTGGMYCGAESAVGHPAEFMISYPGFDSPKYDKSGNLIDAGNEYNLIKYLEKHNRMVPYYQFDRKPFQVDDSVDSVILKDGVAVNHPDYSNIDLIVAVPVCSGLSSATYGITEQAKKARNANMMFLARYTLNTIKPKVYIFENAPRLMADSAASVRAEIEQIAKNAGYSVAYYKTDTKLHDNCQKRPRTFIYFFRVDGDRKGVPKLGFENKNITVEELMSRIPKDATQQESLPLHPICNEMFKYYRSKYGNNWRDNLSANCMIDELLNDHELMKWKEFVMSDPNVDDKTKESIRKYADHIKDKVDQGKGFYVFAPVYLRDHSLPAAMFKTIPVVMHHSEDRLYTIREWLTTMGMPFDFEMYGDIQKYYPKIGQNVPARTAQFIVSEAVKIIENWDTVERSNEQEVIYYNNIKQTVERLSVM